MEASLPCFVWYERIASYCNPADLPSRARIDEACKRWGLTFGGDIALPAELLTALVDGVPFPRLAKVNGDLECVIKPQGRKEDDTDV
jgi:hypothetical protein